MKDISEPNSLNSMEGVPPYNIPVKFEAEKNAEKVSIAPKEVSQERVFEHDEGQVLDLTASEVEIEEMKKARDLQRQEALKKVREELGISERVPKKL